MVKLEELEIAIILLFIGIAGAIAINSSALTTIQKQFLMGIDAVIIILLILSVMFQK